MHGRKLVLRANNVFLTNRPPWWLALYGYLRSRGIDMTVRIETYSSRFGGKVLTDEKLLDFFNVPKLHPTHRWKRLLPISVPVPS